MKHTKELLAVAVGMSMLLAGCSSAGSSSESVSSTVESEAAEAAESTAETGESVSFTVEDIYVNNALDTLLTNHTSLSVTRERFEDGADIASATEQTVYTTNGSYIVMSSVYTDEMSGTIYRDIYRDDTYAGALYQVNDAGEKHFTAFPAADYDSTLSSWWLIENGDEATVTVDSAGMQDDAYVLTTLTTYPESYGAYVRDMYYLDPENGELLYHETMSFLLDAGETVPEVAYGEDQADADTITRAYVTYDSGTLDNTAREAILAEDGDSCELTVVFNPGQTDSETQQFPVVHDTLVSVTSYYGTTLYSDEACTQEIYSTDIDLSGTSATVYAVPGEEDPTA